MMKRRGGEAARQCLPLWRAGGAGGAWAHLRGKLSGRRGGGCHRGQYNAHARTDVSSHDIGQEYTQTQTLDGNIPKRRHWTGIYPNADIGREYTQTQTRHALTRTHTHELYSLL